MLRVEYATARGTSENSRKIYENRLNGRTR